MPENNDFIKQQQRAVERMREMSAHAVPPINSTHSMPPAPPFVRMPNSSPAGARTEHSHTDSGAEFKTAGNKEQGTPKSADFAILERLRTEPDLPLILGLLLLLWNEKADKRLMLALAYIML